jgi:uncharacterized protein (TIGR00251 family)
MHYRAADARLILHIHARPNARRTAVAGLYGDTLKVRIGAPAVDDKANIALLAFLAEMLELPRSALRLKSGATTKRKTVEIVCASGAVVARAAAMAL